jgi:hypothetical protein
VPALLLIGEQDVESGWAGVVDHFSVLGANRGGSVRAGGRGCRGRAITRDVPGRGRRIWNLRCGISGGYGAGGVRTGDEDCCQTRWGGVGGCHVGSED